MRETRGPGKSGGGWLANNESTPYNLLRCPMRGPQVSRESGTAGEPLPEPLSYAQKPDTELGTVPNWCTMRPR